MTDKQLMSIEIYYNNGERLIVRADDIQKLEALSDTMNLLERAKQVYQNIEPLFKKSAK